MNNPNKKRLRRTMMFLNAQKPGLIKDPYIYKADSLMLDLEELPEASEPARLSGSGITLRDVSFSYSGKEEDTVLRHIDLELPAGTFTALVGPSGGGKSTAARLIARFWDVTDGCIAIGGVDIRNLTLDQSVLKQLADQVSFVTQDNFLFDCSLKENIRLGKPDATEEEVWAAARAAQCEEFLGRLEHGWDTPAGEAGKQLSGGERQRIAIARAILKNAPILILDEATSAADPENQVEIDRAIENLCRGKTVVIVAHRLGAIKLCDKVAVVENNTITCCGTHEEVLEKNEYYRRACADYRAARAIAYSVEGGVQHA